MARWRSRHLGATLSAVGLIWMVAAGGAAAGNNGTLKIHEPGTPTETPDNDPKVGCGFGLGPSASMRARPAASPSPSRAVMTRPVVVRTMAGCSARRCVRHVMAGPFDLASGHYKATFYGKDGDDDVKAKSKVSRSPATVVAAAAGAVAGDDGRGLDPNERLGADGHDQGDREPVGDRAGHRRRAGGAAVVAEDHVGRRGDLARAATLWP